MRLLAVVVFLFTVGTATALAAGGRSIGGAPTIVPGAKTTANTQTEPTGPGQEAIGQGCFIDAEWFKLPLAAGDTVKITGTESGGRGFLVAFFSPGTSDRNVADAQSVSHGFPAEHEMAFKAETNGVYPMAVGPNCYNGTDGEFDFTVSVTHGAPPVTLAISTVTNGTVTVKAAGASGVLKLYGTWGGKPHLIGTAKPAGGSATFKLHLPGGVHGAVALQVKGDGATSAVKNVKA